MGDIGRCFFIHKKLLASASKFFNDEFKKKSSSGFIIPVVSINEDPEVFSFIFEWVYRQKLAILPEIKAGTREATSPFIALDRTSASSEEYVTGLHLLIRVYCTAARLSIPGLMNQAIFRLGLAYHQIGWAPVADDIKLAYENGPLDCGLRKYMVRSYSSAFFQCENLEKAEEVNALASELPELFVDFFKMNVGGLWGKKGQSVSFDAVCDYHSHGPDDVCKLRGYDFRGEFNVAC